LNATRRPCGAPLSVPHAYALLELLQIRRGLTTTELATKLSIDRTNVSRLVARMERAGEVKRRANSSDARAKTVMLTPRGKQLANAVDESSAEHFAQLAKALPVPLATVIQSLESLRVTMTRAAAHTDQEDA
jgi:DNA-binding MarR family transcriptional regulator